MASTAAIDWLGNIGEDRVRLVAAIFSQDPSPCKNVASFMLLGYCLWMAEHPGGVEMKLVYVVFSDSPYLFDLRKAHKCDFENTFQPLQ
jgi:hypothetical protein